ncbi:hypothetical protein LJC74_03865 [Eubacteriales bacterium OttesenSCG-928-A19]|nr:hypothetical protein [Eubacteriales bacterium OttesenSCG-928-A19]
MASPSLLAAVRNYLDITWPDAEGDMKLSGIIDRGIKYLDDIVGAPQDYEAATRAQGLLFNYCRYERSNALEEFQKDYLHELLALQLAEGAKAFEEPDTDL